MRSSRRAVIWIALLGLAAGSTTAQTVGIAGEYSANHGSVVNIPQNPPIEDCAASDAAWNAQNRARCVRHEEHYFMTTGAPPSFRAPHHGVYGARLGTAATSTLPTVASPGPRPAGLNAGDPFRLPPGLMQQRLGRQVDIILENRVRQLDTTFTAIAPAASRLENPPLDTRVFQASGWMGQNDGGASPVSRAAAATTITRVDGAEVLTLTYSPGPNAFGGTMTTLLGGTGRFYLTTFFGTAGGPASLNPVVFTNPLRFGSSGPTEEDGAGWDYTVMRALAPGHAKGFGIYWASPSVIDAVIAPRCEVTPPPTPIGCNEINYWESPLPGVPHTTLFPEAVSVFNGAPGLYLGQLIPGATTTRHAFAWTTGQVRIKRAAIRNGVSFTHTYTGRGYDTTSTVGSAQVRNVGLVAGSYNLRSVVGGTQLNPSLVGLDLQFTPEPGATVGLMAGLGLLGAAARRRR